MSYSFPPDIQQIVQDYLASGAYSNADDVLRDALCVLREVGGMATDDQAEFDETVASVRASIADIEAGRMHTLESLLEDARCRVNVRPM